MQYHQKLRQTTGFVSSILTLLGKGYFSIPDYSTLSRRQNILPVSISDRLNKGENLDIAIDSTGLKVYGEGEWKVRQHGITKRRTWRKLHIGIDVNTQEIICVDLTTNSQDDASIATKMLKALLVLKAGLTFCRLGLVLKTLPRICCSLLAFLLLLRISLSLIQISEPTRPY